MLNADFIDGQWGSGKTNFLKNKLFPEIQTIEASVSEKGKSIYFEPIYVSQFGVSNIDEICERLFIELNPKFKSKGAFFLKKKY